MEQAIFSHGVHRLDIVVCASGDESLIKDLIWTLANELPLDLNYSRCASDKGSEG